MPKYILYFPLTGDGRVINIDCGGRSWIRLMDLVKQAIAAGCSKDIHVYVDLRRQHPKSDDKDRQIASNDANAVIIIERKFDRTRTDSPPEDVVWV